MRYHRRVFTPPLRTRNAHLQTVGGLLVRRAPALPAARARVELADGDFVDLDVFDVPGVALPEDAPVALVVHGLEGSSGSGYVQHTARHLAAEGVRAVGFNMRGCSGEPNRTHRAYHAGAIDDVRAGLDHVAARCPGVPIGAIGFSMGGNQVLKLLGELGDAAPEWLRAAVAVSVPFDLARCVDHLAVGLNRGYSRYFLRSLLGKLRDRTELLRPHCDVEAGLRVRTIRAYDHLVTAPLHGFAGADAYYEAAVCTPALEGIARPTLVLQALDDPFMPTGTVPVERLRRHASIEARLTRHGGHVGFLRWRRSLRRPELWAEATAARWLADRLRA